MSTPSSRRDRYRLDGQLKITVFRPAGRFDFWGRISDVSEGGLGAIVSGELEPGEFVVLQFSLSSSPHVLELRACVCHRRGYYCGFEFLVVSDVQRERIKLACEGLPTKDGRKEHGNS
jgi:c-di-GMP-binding flagellar brake protein YcgR